MDSEDTAQPGVEIFQLHGVNTEVAQHIYAQRKELSSASFQEQQEVLYAAHKQEGLLLTEELKRLGVSTFTAFGNCKECQLQWAYENDKTLAFPDFWEMDIILEQINRFRPRFLLISSPMVFDSKILRMLTWKPFGIMGWLDGMPRIEVDWTQIDVMLSTLPELEEAALKHGAKNTKLFLAGTLPVFQSPTLHKEYDLAVIFEKGHKYERSQEILEKVLELRKQSPFGVKLLSQKGAHIPEFLKSFTEELPPGHETLQREREKARVLLHLAPDWLNGKVGSHQFFQNLASGTPVMVSHYSNVSDFMLPGYEITTFEDADHFQSALDGLLTDKERRIDLARQAGQRLSNEYGLAQRAYELAAQLNIIPETPEIDEHITQDNSAPESVSTDIETHPTDSDQTKEEVSETEATPDYVKQAEQQPSPESPHEKNGIPRVPTNDEIRDLIEQRLIDAGHSINLSYPEPETGNQEVDIANSQQKTTLPPDSEKKGLLLFDVLDEAITLGKIKIACIKEHTDDLPIIAALPVGQIISLIEEGKNREAAEKLKFLREKDIEPLYLPPDFVPQKITKSEILLEQAHTLYEKQDYTACLKSLRKLQLREDEPGPDALLLRAKCIREIDHLDAPWTARCAALEARRLYPENQEAQQLTDELLENLKEQRSPHLTFDDDFRKIYQRVAEHSMLPELTMFSLFSRVKLILERGVQGDFIDFGCSAGGSALLIALTIEEFSPGTRKVFAFDTFDGMPRHSKQDSILGATPVELGWSEGTCRAREKDVIKLFEEFEVGHMLRLKKGLIENTFPAVANDIQKVALANIDLGLQSSTYKALELISPLLHRDGSVAVHHGLGWNGVEKAIESKLRESDFRLKKISEECAIFWLGPKVGFAWTDSRLGSAKEYL